MITEQTMMLYVMTRELGATVTEMFFKGLQWLLPGRTADTVHAMTGHKQADKKLRQLRTAVETMQLGVTITDLEGTILYTNPAEAAMHGYKVEELLGKDLGIFAPAGRRSPMSTQEIVQMKRQRESVNVRRNGTRFPVRLMSDIVTDRIGRPMAIVTTCEDISDYKRTTEKLEQYARELLLLNQMSDQLQASETEEDTYRVITTVCQKLFPLNSGCLCILKSTTTMMEIVDFWGQPPMTSQIACHSTEPSVSIEGSNPHSDANTLCPHQVYCPYHECLSAPIVASGELLGMVSLCFAPQETAESDDTYAARIESKQTVLNRIVEHYALSLSNLRLREKLRIEAVRDPLTGLYNRRYMQDALEREATRAERRQIPVGIIMLDIDHFKNFNDTYGHNVGDAVLRELGIFLLAHIRGEDITCRYGGEEFLLILPEADLATATQRAQHLQKGIKNLRIRYHKASFRITASFGVATFPGHGPDIMHAVQQADIALYQAKARGRDQVITADL